MNELRGFIKHLRSETARELLRDPFANHLLTVIALRARFTNEPNLAGLTFGQAFIGDWNEIGLTRSQARAAMRRLAKWSLARFDGTPAGTIATLLDSRVYSLRDERPNGKRDQPHGQPVSEGKSAASDQPNNQVTTNKQPANDQATTTNEECQNGQHGEHEQIQSLFPPITAEQIYEAYPKKVGRQDALKAIAKAILIVGPERLLERVTAYNVAVRRWSQGDRQFIPYPATWFNKGNYDDDPATWIRNNARPGQRDSHNLDNVNF